MPQVVRVGDANGAGGKISGPGASSVLVDGQPVSVLGDQVTPHPPCGRPGGQPHCSATVIEGSGTVTAEGSPIVFVGASDSCGHSRVGGSSTVEVGY